MRLYGLLCVGAMALGAAATCKATPISPAPFGAASAYNLFAIGTVDSHGNTVLPGTINTGADVTGRIAASFEVLNASSIGQGLNSDPYGSLAPFDLISPNGLQPGQGYINVGSHGDVYAPGTNGNFNFNGGGHRQPGYSGATQTLDFNAIRTALDAQTMFLGTLGATGTNVGLARTNPAISGVNPSDYILLGTNATLNVFTLGPADLALLGSNHPLDIHAPAGSTIIVNVTGSNITLGGGGLYYNESQNTGDSSADNKILFNLAGATNVYIDGQFSASVLAPFAFLSGGSQMDGNFIAAQIGSTGEVHNVEFTGNLPQPPTTPPAVPEPGTFALLGTGLFTIAATVRRRKDLAPGN